KAWSMRVLQAVADILKLLERLVRDTNLAALLALVVDEDLKAETIRDGFFKPQRIGILLRLRSRCGILRRHLRGAHKLLSGPHRKPTPDHLLGQRLRVGAPDKRAHMPRGEDPRLNVGLH